MLHFEKLVVWQKSLLYARELVKMADELPQKYQSSFGDQLRRSALSIPNNIAEGSGRASSRDRANFYSVARGSLYESVNILKLLEELKLSCLKGFNFGILYGIAEEVAKMIFGLSKRS
ncbi:MAG: 23S rRNA-intervening sequence protein [Candidatus Woesebacteria bacterium]|jgi:four helix bundle protein|nr:MAG: 23S rRNA-intervening sequence protein [Candidatus Woesebacteria bacterium]